jgi:hypothetical protein
MNDEIRRNSVAAAIVVTPGATGINTAAAHDMNPDVKTARQAIDSALNSLVVHSDNLLATPARAATAKQRG